MYWMNKYPIIIVSINRSGMNIQRYLPWKKWTNILSNDYISLNIFQFNRISQSSFHPGSSHIYSIETTKYRTKNNWDLLPRANNLKPQYMSTSTVVDYSRIMGVFLFCFSVYMFMWSCVSVFVGVELDEMDIKYDKNNSAFMPAPFTWSLNICHIKTAGSANNSRHYGVVWPPL